MIYIIIGITIILLLIVRLTIIFNKGMGDLTGRFFYYHTPNNIVLKVEYIDENYDKKIRTATKADIKILKKHKKLK